MPAAQMNWNKIGLLLAVGTFSAVAIPALSGDWQSASFFAAQNNQVGASIQGFDQPRDSLEFSADRDYGRLVLGGSYSRGSGSLFSGLGGAAGTERVSLRAGYDFGQSLGYVSLGRQQALALRGEDGYLGHRHSGFPEPRPAAHRGISASRSFGAGRISRSIPQPDFYWCCVSFLDIALGGPKKTC
jgi:outer membrane immunogenic protein